MSDKIHLVGGGLSGALLGVFLARRGYAVELFERRNDMRKEDMSAGRSINLALSARGLAALEKVGLVDEVMQDAIPMRGRMIHPVEGEAYFMPYGKDEHEVIYAISRGDLNKVLLNAAERHNSLNLHFNRRCTDFNLRTGAITFEDEAGEIFEEPSTVAIGTDGAGSALRMSMLKGVPRFSFSQDFLEYGYKELLIPAGADGGFLIDKNALHIWPRANYMLIALPNPDGSFTCTLFFPYEGAESFAALESERDVRAFFDKVFPDASKLMPQLEHEFFTNPTGHLATVRCQPWHSGAKALLLGDAAHAVVPFFGQGMNCCFEDCAVFDALLKNAGNNPDWANLFAAFEKARKPNADAIADMALENFVEMRDSVADPTFQLKKKVGQLLEAEFAGRFIPRYSMVTFHPEIPYAEAQRKGRAQDEILNELCRDISTPDQLDMAKAAKLVATLN